jgi:N-dimethylarginine dimethylaminohydrolase
MSLALEVDRPTVVRRSSTHRYLMCRPRFFDVVYSINPWMHLDVPVDTELAMAQWIELVAAYRRLGHRVDIIEGEPGQPDMVFAANAATVIDGVAVAARFRSDKRTGEERPYQDWLRAHMDRVVVPQRVNEGEGDFLWTGRYLLAGSGFRTDPLSHGEVGEALGVPVIGLRLVDPSFYHLDTALAVLDQDTIAYYPGAFSAGSRSVLERLYPDAILADLDDARWFGLNAVSDGRNVVVAAQARRFAEQLADAGFEPVPVDVSEFRKSGGGIKCCTLELRM